MSHALFMSLVRQKSLKEHIHLSHIQCKTLTKWMCSHFPNASPISNRQRWHSPDTLEQEPQAPVIYGGSTSQSLVRQSWLMSVRQTSLMPVRHTWQQRATKVDLDIVSALPGGGLSCRHKFPSLLCACRINQILSRKELPLLVVRGATTSRGATT